MRCYQLPDIPLDLSHPITESLASQYLTSSVIGGGPIYSLKMLRFTALYHHKMLQILITLLDYKLVTTFGMIMHS